MTLAERIDTLTDNGFQDPVISALLGLDWADLETYRTVGTLPDPTVDLTGGLILGTELAGDPPAPPANSFVLYGKDNGAGKTVVAARFATGAVQAVATQP